MDSAAHRSRNFPNLSAVTNGHNHPEHLPHGYFMMGMLQAFRDFLSKKYGKEIPITATSGDRTGYNQNVVNAAKDSYHMWGDRPYKGVTFMCVACDIKSSVLSLQVLYEEAVKFFRGEVYINLEQGIVHVAPFGEDETFTIDVNGKTINYRKGALQ